MLFKQETIFSALWIEYTLLKHALLNKCVHDFMKVKLNILITGGKGIIAEIVYVTYTLCKYIDISSIKSKFHWQCYTVGNTHNKSIVSKLGPKQPALKMLGRYLYTLIIGHKSCNMLSILNKLTLQKVLQNFVTNSVLIDKQ